MFRIDQIDPVAGYGHYGTGQEICKIIDEKWTEKETFRSGQEEIDSVTSPEITAPSVENMTIRQ
jgi:hypothetical protein